MQMFSPRCLCQHLPRSYATVSTPCRVYLIVAPSSSPSPDIIGVVLIAKRCGLSSQKTSIAVRFAAPYRFFGYVASTFLSFSSHLLVSWVVSPIRDAFQSIACSSLPSQSLQPPPRCNNSVGRSQS